MRRSHACSLTVQSVARERARARTYIMRTPGRALVHTCYRESRVFHLLYFVLHHARGSLISHWWHGEAHSLVLRDLSPRGRGMATANTGVSCQDPPPPPLPLGMRAHEKHTTLSSHKAQGRRDRTTSPWRMELLLGTLCLWTPRWRPTSMLPPARPPSASSRNTITIRTCYT